MKSQDENINVRKEAIQSRESTLELNKKNVLTLKESEEGRKKQLEAELENARTRLHQLEDTTEEEKELTRHARVGAEASLLQAQSQLESQQERYEWTTVIAPMAGTITRLTVEEGEIITSGAFRFFTWRCNYAYCGPESDDCKDADKSSRNRKNKGRPTCRNQC